MTGNPSATKTRSGSRMLAALAAGLLMVGTLFTATPTHAAGPDWQQLTVAERQVLAPLASQWDSIDATRKEKWRDIAGRYPGLSATEQGRVQSRMAEWARLGAEERGKARIGYQEAKQVPADERQARWQAYQSLPPEQRRELATRAAERASAPAPAPAHQTAAAAALLASTGSPSGGPQAKSNVVATPQTATAGARTVAPGVLQAPAGATTRPLNQRATPAAHQPPGLPKITTSPGFVNPNTLLPQRGAQGAAVIEPEDKKKHSN